MAGLKRDTKLQRVIRLLYQMQSADVDQLAARLLEMEKRAWRTALAEKARQYTGRALSPRDPSGADLRVLKDWAQADAESIAKTYNRAVEKQLNKLFEQNPRGNRTYYAKHMEAWSASRSEWHSNLVASTTVQKTRAYAKDRFAQMNNLRAPGYFLAGPPPVCDVCNEAQAAGVVDYAYTQRVPMPNHPLCEHEWEEATAGRRLKPSDLWLG